MSNLSQFILSAFNAITVTSINKVALTQPATLSTLTIINGKTLTISKTISFTAADDTGVYTLPTGTKTLVATDVTTLSALTTVGALNSGSITSGFGSIDVGTDAISGGAINATGDISTTSTGRVHVRGAGSASTYDLQLDNDDSFAYFRATRSNAFTKGFKWYLDNSLTLGMTLTSTGLAVTAPSVNLTVNDTAAYSAGSSGATLLLGGLDSASTYANLGLIKVNALASQKSEMKFRVLDTAGAAVYPLSLNAGLVTVTGALSARNPTAGATVATLTSGDSGTDAALLLVQRYDGAVSASLKYWNSLTNLMAFTAVSGHDIGMVGSTGIVGLRMTAATGDIATKALTVTGMIRTDDVILTTKAKVIGYELYYALSGSMQVGGSNQDNSFVINTPTLTSDYPSGLGIDGSYSDPVSTINIKAFGVKYAGAYSSKLVLHTTFGGVLSPRATLDYNGLIISAPYLTINPGTGASKPAYAIYQGTNAASTSKVGYCGVNVYGTDGSLELMSNSTAMNVKIGLAGSTVLEVAAAGLTLNGSLGIGNLADATNVSVIANQISLQSASNPRYILTSTVADLYTYVGFAAGTATSQIYQFAQGYLAGDAGSMKLLNNTYGIILDGSHATTGVVRLRSNGVNRLTASNEGIAVNTNLQVYNSSDTLLNASLSIGSLVFRNTPDNFGFYHAGMYMERDPVGAYCSALVFKTELKSASNGTNTSVEVMRLNRDGNLTLPSTTDATSTTAASLVTAGGLAVAKTIISGGAISQQKQSYSTTLANSVGQHRHYLPGDNKTSSITVATGAGVLVVSGGSAGDSAMIAFSYESATMSIIWRSSTRIELSSTPSVLFGFYKSANSSTISLKTVVGNTSSISLVVLGDSIVSTTDPV